MTLTGSGTRPYRSTPPMHALLRTLGVVAAAIALGCSPDPQSDPAPLDRFTYPVGLAVRGQELLVVSSNFDLRYATADGGSLMRVALTDPPALQPGGVRIGSFGGELALVDPAACPQVGAAQAIVASRLETKLYRVPLGTGDLACGAGCTLDFSSDPRLGDPYGIGITCPQGGPARAWVSFLRTPLREGWIEAIDLADPSSRMVISMGAGNVRSFAYDAETARLFMTGIDTGLSAPLRWIELGGGCDPTKLEIEGGCIFKAFDLWPSLRGAELSGIALSNPQPGLPRRIYLTARVFDPDLAATLGIRPGFDVGGALIVVEVSEGATGDLQPRVVRIVRNLGIGAAEVRVLPPRPPVACAASASGCPQRDLLAMTFTEDQVLYVYDDDAGAIRDVFGRDPATGTPGTGRSPFALAVQDLRATPGAGDGTARVYVGSFTDFFVTAIDVPLSGSAPADYVRDATGSPHRIGVTP
jgi:hypothetical protein